MTHRRWARDVRAPGRGAIHRRWPLDDLSSPWHGLLSERHGKVDWGGGVARCVGAARQGTVVNDLLCCRRDLGIRDYIAVANDDSI
jgi:hypothetical protein